MADCPASNVLRSWAQGKLSTDEYDRCSKHVDTCPRCQAWFANWRRGDSPAAHSDVDTTAIGDLAGPMPIPQDVRSSHPSETHDLSRRPSSDQLDNPKDAIDLRMELKVRCPHCHLVTPTRSNADDQTVVCRHCGGGFNVAPSELGSNPASAVRRINQFVLSELLGVGAFGQVWKAQDTKLDRTVAIKMPRRDLLDESDVNRFLNEARAAARLAHPNIVQVYEVGRADNRIYIACELIRGLQLDQWMERCRPDERQAATLVAKIADALHTAHNAGIVHRDLKPANILIDESAEPHVTDFGVAKRSTAGTTHSVDGAVVGTLSYMPPEQARGQSARADRRSDIYSLGVILFQLLTGELPFRGSPQMVLLQILNDDPPSPRKFSGQLSRDLETICLKCLQKEPHLRYPNSAELAADLRRFLAGHAVSARPIGPFARAVRWSRRKPLVAVLISTVSMLVMAILLGSSIASWVFLRQRIAAEELASSNARISIAERRMRRLADQRLVEARRAVYTSFVRISKDTLLNQPGMQTLRRDLMEQATIHYEQLLTPTAEDTAARLELGMAYGHLAEMQLEIGETERAVAANQQACVLLEELHSIEPESSDVLAALAAAVYDRADLMRIRGQWPEAEAICRQAIDLRSRLRAAQPRSQIACSKLAAAFNLLSIIKSHSGDFDAAEAALSQGEASLESLDRDDRSLPDIQNQLASFKYNRALLLRDQGQTQTADRLFKQSQAIRETLVRENPENHEFCRSLVYSYGEYAAFQQYSLHDLESAEASMHAAVELAERLKNKNPNVFEYGRDLASLNNNLSGLYLQMGQREKALEAINSALAHWNALIEIGPTSDLEQGNADAQSIKANLLVEQGQIESGQQLLQAANQTYLASADSSSNPTHAEFKWLNSNWQLSYLDVLLGQYQDGIARCEEMLARIQRLREFHKTLTFAGRSLEDWEILALASRAEAESRLGEHDAAMQSFRQAMTSLNPQIRDDLELSRAAAQARKGDVSTALQTARAVERRSSIDARTAHALARIYAIAATQRQLVRPSTAENERELESKWLDAANQWVTRAKREGFYQSPLNAKLLLILDSDFVKLRANPDFQTLTKDLRYGTENE